MIKLGKYFANYFTAKRGTGKGWLEMSNKKQIKNLGKKAIITFLASVLILSTAALPLAMLVPKPAKAAVTVSTISGAPQGMMIGPGMLFPALGINVAADAVETLVSVKVNILIPEGSGKGSVPLVLMFCDIVSG